MNTHFLRLKDVLAATGLGRSTIYHLIKKEQFPKAIKLGPKSVAWKSDDVEAWMQSRPYTDDH